MSADGSVEVQVQAEGVDDAAEELADADAGGGGGGGDGGGGDGASGLRGSLKAGLFAGILTSVAGPLLEVLNPMLSVLQAFLAPVAALLLRVLAPFLRFTLTKILPKWLKFLNVGTGELQSIRKFLGTLLAVGTAGLLAIPAIPFIIADLLGIKFDEVQDRIETAGSDIATFVKNGFSNAVDEITSLPGDIWSKVQQLAPNIAGIIAEAVPGVSAPSSDDGGNNGPLGQARDVVDTAGDRVNNVNISGGLGAFVDEVEQTSGIDLP